MIGWNIRRRETPVTATLVVNMESVIRATSSAQRVSTIGRKHLPVVKVFNVMKAVRYIFLQYYHGKSIIRERRKSKKFQAFSMKRFLRSDAIISRASFPLFYSWPKANCLSAAIRTKRKMKSMAISGTCSNTHLKEMSIYNGVKKSCQQMRCIRHRKFKMKSSMSQRRLCVKKLWLKWMNHHFWMADGMRDRNGNEILYEMRNRFNHNNNILLATAAASDIDQDSFDRETLLPLTSLGLKVPS